MRYSHSRVECFNSCPFKYKCRYKDKLKLIDSHSYDSALICGNAIHKGAETSVEAAIQWYYDQYNIINDNHVNEAVKFEYWIKELKKLLNQVDVAYQEYQVKNDRFIGYVDLITNNPDGSVDVFDFKYSNNYHDYLDSKQLHLYKYFLEKEGFTVRNLGFIFVPKVELERGDMDLITYRKALTNECKKYKIKVIPIEYDHEKVINWYDNIIDINECKNYKKNFSAFCHWCEYEDYCVKGESYMILPSSERRDISKVEKRKIWIYGTTMSGKTTMLDDAPKPLNINTDGNINFVTMPYVILKDEKVRESKRTWKTKRAWSTFLELLDELEKKENDFQTIIIDLVEDQFQMCRDFVCDELGIIHESDKSMSAWDIVRNNNYLKVMRRFFNLPYENLVIVSHEDKSKNIMNKKGTEVTAIKPNIQDKVATKLAGMCDLVGRVVIEDDGRYLDFHSDNVIFGGGRLRHMATDKIPLSWESLVELYDLANKKINDKKDLTKEERNDTINTESKSKEVIQETKADDNKEDTTRRSRRFVKNS